MRDDTVRSYRIRVTATAQLTRSENHQNVKRPGNSKVFTIIRLYAIEIASTLVFVVFISVEAVRAVRELILR